MGRGFDLVFVMYAGFREEADCKGLREEGCKFIVD
jgi:hypothetical protein